ncbi:hypothetical protein GGU11DRAFT_750879 [Lentinula aff. detonsa]|nr:hypothetical protein GGU11DRAFT_750879 [Lentinula aff. detonsa]
MAEFVINSHTHSALGMSPFELTYGYLPLFNIPEGQRSGIPAVDNRIQILWDARQHARRGEAISNALAPFSPRSASEDDTRISKTMREVQRDSDD